MKERNVKDKLDKLLSDPLKGTLKKGSNAVLEDLRARLANLEKNYRKATPPDSVSNKPEAAILRQTIRRPGFPDSGHKLDIQSLASVGQQLYEDSEGFSLWENSFPYDHMHGELLLSSIKRLKPESFSTITSQFKKKLFDPQGTMFIDTETTGLAGGTGTLAFMIGVGYYDQGGFKVRQYFIRDYGEENAALNSLVKFASRFENIITFNGRGYDIPILQARMILNRIKFDFSTFSHIDLLFPSRAIFKHRLEDCRLSTLERNVIRFFREGDIPGEEIPYLYFRYLRSRNPALMDKVFYHNAMDIVSLAVLTTRIGELLDHEQTAAEFGEDIFGAGHFYYKANDYKNAELLFRKAFDYPLPYDLRYRLLTELSLILKRTGKIDEASEIWHGMLEGQKKFTLFPYEELAKYYEHHKKSASTAMKIVNQAVKAMQETRSDINSRDFGMYQKELLERLKRLENKTRKLSW